MKTPLTASKLTLSVALLGIGVSTFAQQPTMPQSAIQSGDKSPVSLDFGNMGNTPPASLQLPASLKSTAQIQTVEAKPKAAPKKLEIQTVELPKAAAKTKKIQTAAVKPNVVLAQTKPDIVTPSAAATKLDTIDNPSGAIGGSGRMMFLLAPMLLVTVGALKLLQRYQQKTGRLPAGLQKKAIAHGQAKAPKSGGILSAIMGSFSLNNARERGGSNIRVVESVPIGGVNIHLVEVRGRLLLLGASGGNVNMLTEFQETEIDGSDFRALLNAAAAEMDGLSEFDSLPTSAVVGSIEDDLRGAGEAVEKRLRRLRTVQEAEANPDWMRFDDAR